MYYESISATGAPLDALIIELTAATPLNGPTGPGVYDLAFTNFNDCGLCLYILSRWTGGTPSYEKLLVPTEGTIDIKSLSGSGGTFEAELKGVVLQEATLNTTTMEVKIVSGGMRWCLDGVVLNTTIKVPSETCVTEGTGIMLGDNIGNFKLQNCNGEWVELHSKCEHVKAIWIVAVAGW
jgi:hypothetical protein